MDYFDATKKTTLENLYKSDNSKKGTVDDEAIPIIEEINKKSKQRYDMFKKEQKRLFCILLE